MEDVSNNELARMIGEGFSSVDEKFADAKKDINQHFAVLENELSDIKTRLENVEADKSEIATMKKRMASLEEKMEELRIKVAA